MSMDIFRLLGHFIFRFFFLCIHDSGCCFILLHWWWFGYCYWSIRTISICACVCCYVPWSSLVFRGGVRDRSCIETDCTGPGTIFPRSMECIRLHSHRTWCHWIAVGRCPRFIRVASFSSGKWWLIALLTFNILIVLFLSLSLTHTHTINGQLSMHNTMKNNLHSIYSNKFIIIIFSVHFFVFLEF